MSEASPPELVSGVADLARIDSSVISPQTAERIRTFASEINTSIVADYGPFIPDRIVKRNADLGDRIVIVDDVNRVRKEIDGIDLEGKKTNSQEVGCNKRNERITIILDPQLAWEKFSQPIPNPRTALEIHLQNIHNAYLSQHGKDEEKARLAFEHDFLRHTIAHEFFHHYSADNLSPKIDEVPTAYYTEELLRKHKMVGFNGIADTWDIEGYRNVITKFGNDITQSWYFSGDVGFFKKLAIEHSINNHLALFAKIHPAEKRLI